MEKKKHPWVRTVLLWAGLVIVFLVIYNYLGSCNNERQITVSYTQFIKSVTDGNIEQISMEGYKIFGQTKQGESFIAYMPAEDETLLPLLREHNVQITVIPVSTSNYSWLWQVLMIVPIALIFLFLMRSSGSQAMKFGKSKAKLLDDKTRKVTFADVAGIDETLEEVKEVVDFLKNPKEFGKLGGRVPKGILLKGAPGTGKTLLARAVAGEAKVSFFSVSGSEFVEMFVGVGASRIRDLFEEARNKSPCIVFVDEMDALGRQRGAAGFSNNHDEANQTLNQLLTELDGVGSDQGIVVLAATNRPDVLDPGLMRAGRFDRHIEVPRPDINGREAILAVHAKKIKMNPNVDLRKVAQATPGMVGADLENIVNEAALLATRAKKESVEEADFHEAIERVGMGPARKSHKMSEEEKWLTAVHEAAHALLGVVLKNFRSVLRRVSIIPRGEAGGVTWFMPPENKIHETKNSLLAMLQVSLGGRAAEEIFLNDISTGASNDIMKTTHIARAMVCEWGMGKMGPMAIGTTRGNALIGMVMRDDSEVSEHTKQLVDAEVGLMINEAYSDALTALKDNVTALKLIADLLMEKETLTAEEVKEIVGKFSGSVKSDM